MPRVVNRRPIDNLLRFARARQLNQSRLAELMDVLPQHITNWKDRGLPPGQFVRAARAVGITVEQLLEGADEIDGGPPPAAPPFLEGSAGFTVFLRPGILAADTLMLHNAPLPSEFVCAVPDDALSPDTPRGTVLMFSTQALPQPGLGVLVQDRDGRRYVRRYTQAHGGRFLATASHRDYVTLDSDTDGLEVLAVATGRMGGGV